MLISIDPGKKTNRSKYLLYLDTRTVTELTVPLSEATDCLYSSITSSRKSDLLFGADYANDAV